MSESAALYIRLSKEDEGDGPSESVMNQRSLLEDYVKRQGITVYDVYIDDGWSGTNFDRPAFCRMIKDIEDGLVNLVITKDLSRLGRDYILTGHYLERFFPEHRVRYVSLLDGVDTGLESAANEITPFRAIMNDMYAKDISKKIRSVKRDKQRRGLFIGGKPVYGYRLHPTEKNRLVIDEPAAENVRYIFSLAAEGMSCRGIAVRLNAEGVPSPSKYAGLTVANPGPYSGMWSAERISDMLQNETYIGNMVQGRSVKASYKSKKSLKQKRKDWIIVPDTHEPIVSREEFRAVQALLNTRRSTRCRTYDFPLKGLVFCHECGYPLAVINRKNAAGEDVLYFACRTYQRFTKERVCTGHIIREKTVTDAVEDLLKSILREYLRPESLVSIAERIFQSSPCDRDREHERRSLTLQISQISEKLERVYLDHLDGILSETDFSSIYSRLKKKRHDLESKRQTLENEQSEQPPEERIKAVVHSYLSEGTASRRVLAALIERVEITEDKRVIVRFRFRQPKESD